MSESRTRAGYYQDRIDSGAYAVTAVTYREGGFSIKATLITETTEQAREAAARFPKSVKACASFLSGADYHDQKVSDPRYGSVSGPLRNSGDYYHGWAVGHVSVTFHFTSNGVTGAKNETALKRYRSFRRNAEKLGIPVAFEGVVCANSIGSEADLESLLADYAKTA